MKSLNNRNHEVGNDKCKVCERVIPYYEDNYKDKTYNFPKRCICGGLIHYDSWGFDDGYDSSIFYKIQCDKCLFSWDLYWPDTKDEFLGEMELFKKRVYLDRKRFYLYNKLKRKEERDKKK